MRRTVLGSSRRPRTPRNSARPLPATASVGRPAASQFRRARWAGTPKGTARSRPPLPRTRTSRRSSSTSSMSRPHSSLTRVAVAYSSSRTASSRTTTALWPAALWPAAGGSPPSGSGRGRAANSSHAWAAVSTVGSDAGRRGPASRSATSAASHPCRAANALKPRATEARLASVVAAAPRARIPASHPRSTPRSTPVGPSSPTSWAYPRRWARSAR